MFLEIKFYWYECKFFPIHILPFCWISHQCLIVVGGSNSTSGRVTITNLITNLVTWILSCVDLDDFIDSDPDLFLFFFSLTTQKRGYTWTQDLNKSNPPVSSVAIQLLCDCLGLTFLWFHWRVQTQAESVELSWTQPSCTD